MTPAGSKHRRAALIATASVISVLIAILVFEIGYRGWIVYRLYEHRHRAAVWIQNQTTNRSNVDQVFGIDKEEPPIGIFKRDTTLDLSIVHPSHGAAHFTVRTNNVGLLSDHDYTVERRPDQPEYRIVVLGESFTGPTTATYQWVDSLEEILNTDAELRRTVGDKTFRTYNFGWIGGGFQTFVKEYEKGGRHFDPDLVLVNYTEIDYPRSNGPHFSNENDMIENARSSLRAIMAANPNTIITLMPLRDDLLPPGKVANYQLTDRLAAADPGLGIVRMKDVMPLEQGALEINNWFNAPFDFHYSDRGGEIYARRLASLIAERITGRRVDYSLTKTKHSDEVLDPKSPRNRLVWNSVAHLAANGEAIYRIKRHAMWAAIRAKTLTLRPYSLYFLLGAGTDGIAIPFTRPIKGAFERIKFGDGPGQHARLNIACASEPYGLDNPDCFHNHSFFYNTAGDKDDGAAPPLIK